MTVEFLIFRHPSSKWNEEKIHQGQSPKAPGLSLMGYRQAEKIAEFLARYDLSGIWSSPLRRSVELADIIQKNQSIPPVIHFDRRLIEMSHGPICGLSEEEIKNMYPLHWQRWMEGKLVPNGSCFPGGETPRQVATRGRMALQEIAYVSLSKLSSPIDILWIAVVSHGLLLSFTFTEIDGQPLSRVSDYWLDNGSLSVVDWNGESLRLREKNRVLHLGNMYHTPEVRI